MQERLIDFLDAEFHGLAGNYDSATAGLRSVHKALEATDTSTPIQLTAALRDVTNLSAQMNAALANGRFRPLSDRRHPSCCGEAVDTSRRGAFDTIHHFYSVASASLRDSEDELTAELKAIRRAILSDVPEKAASPERIAMHRCARYEARLHLAAQSLGIARDQLDPSDNDVRACHNAGLETENAAFAAFVIRTLTQAQLDRYTVESLRSVAVGRSLSRTAEDRKHETDLLNRASALFTFTYASSMALPWAFAGTADERELIRSDPKTAYDALEQEAVWIARGVAMLSIYRRAQILRLLGHHEQSYNDLRKVQRIARRTRNGLGSPHSPNHLHPRRAAQRAILNTLETFAEFRIGELYRGDHDAAQGLVHLCRSHDLLTNEDERGLMDENSLAAVHIRLGKGKAFFEVGMAKRALKWYIRALCSLRSVAGLPKAMTLPTLERYLDSVKHAPEVDKRTLCEHLDGTLDEFLETGAAKTDTFAALFADVLVRIAHVFMVLRLEGDDSPVYASTLFKHAAKLDRYNLLAWTGLLRCELRGAALCHGDEISPPAPMACWPYGASEVDQGIRVGEYLMLSKLVSEGSLDKMASAPTIEIARALLGHFHTHTDSINVRVSVHDRYLMRGRHAREQRRNYAETIRRDVHGPKPDSIEFVCLRRYGSFHPLMPRPASVSAVGGGYFLRVLAAHEPIFNILIDPGHGTVHNLYRAGLSIADVDMIVVTHDHPDHLANLDALISLRHEYYARERAVPKVTQQPPERMLVLGNDSVVSRYSMLNGKGDYVVLHLNDVSVHQCDEFRQHAISITALPTRHRDIGKLEALGFVLALDNSPVRVTVMSDTSIDCLTEYTHLQLDSRPLESGIVVAHLSDAPSGELRDLSKLGADDRAPDDGTPEFGATLNAFLEHRPEHAVRLMNALSLVDHRNPDKPFGLFGADFAQMMRDCGWQHLFLGGLLKVADEIARVDDGTKRVLVIGELREQLGSFRGTIAREVNRHMFKRTHGRDCPDPLDFARSDSRPVALTADIGLRILASAEGQFVYCSTCGLDNDHIAEERFHQPEDIREVCIKGDHEAMYWNCTRHDPSMRAYPAFVEHLGSYDPLSAGGRYHG